MTFKLPDVDLGDTSRCGEPGKCRGCGSTVDDAVIVTLDTQVGVLCVTLCPEHRGDLPQFSVFEAVDRTCRHAGHLGIDVDQMAALMAKEESRAALDDEAAAAMGDEDALDWERYGDNE